MPGLLRAAEERDETERAVQPRLDVIGEERAEHEDAPQPEHDARDRGEQLDERPDDAAHATRSQLAEVEADRDGERGRDDERDERGDRRPVDERQRAEDVLDRIPGPPGDEAEAEVVERGAGQREDLPDDRADEDETRERGGQRQAVERKIAEPAAQPVAAGLQRARRRSCAHRARAY